MRRKPRVGGRVPWELVIPLVAFLVIVAFTHQGQFYNCSHLPYTEAWNVCIQP